MTSFSSYVILRYVNRYQRLNTDMTLNYSIHVLTKKNTQKIEHQMKMKKE